MLTSKVAICTQKSFLCRTSVLHIFSLHHVLPSATMRALLFSIWSVQLFTRIVGFIILAPGKNTRRSRSPLIVLQQQQQGKTNAFCASIQTAQWLLNDRKHDLLRDEIQKKYPILPSSVLDTAIDIVATGFQTVAPETLEKALQPGGMETFRPTLENTIIDYVMKTPTVRDIPLLKQSEKLKLVEFVVDMALDTILKDAEWVLAPPQWRLDKLHQEIVSIQKTEMTSLQVWVYRMKRHAPGRYRAVLMGLAVWAFVRYALPGSYEAALRLLQSGWKSLGRWIVNIIIV